jgi:phosphoglycolate phosphatase
VLDTLLWLKRRGVPIILYTESLEYYTNYRIKKLELDGLVDVVYSPEDHEVPGHISEMQTRSDPLEVGKLRFTAHRGIPRNVIKPNPEVLFDILNDQKIDRDKCVYVGDSLMKDVAMAQKAGIADVYAAYGHVQTHPGYDLLRKVSHWTEEDVQREKNISDQKIVPSHTIQTFSQLRSLFE